MKEKLWNSLECIGAGDNFLNRIPVAKTLRSIINTMKPNHPIKNGVHKQRILNRGLSNGLETFKRMFNIFSHQGIANQND